MCLNEPLLMVKGKGKVIDRITIKLMIARKHNGH